MPLNAKQLDMFSFVRLSLSMLEGTEVSGFLHFSIRLRILQLRETFMADSRPDIVTENRLLERAIWKKWNKFTWSGLLFMGVGLIIIVGGLFLNTGAYSAEGLIVGLGVIVVIVGIIRLLIGIINPLSPEDLRVIHLPGEDSSPANELEDASSE
jgi:hypothetical protein